MRKILFALSTLAILSACNGSSEGDAVVADSIPVADSVEVVDTTSVHVDTAVVDHAEPAHSADRSAPVL